MEVKRPVLMSLLLNGVLGVQSYLIVICYLGLLEMVRKYSDALNRVVFQLWPTRFNEI